MKSYKRTTSLLVKKTIDSVLGISSYIQLLDGCIVTLIESSKLLILQAIHEMSMNALCCLGHAFKDVVVKSSNYDSEIQPAHNFYLILLYKVISY